MPVDNTPAFPINSDNYAHPDNAGMTLRDYFAAAALQGGLSHNRPASDAEGWARWAYKMADAMIKERNGGAA